MLVNLALWIILLGLLVLIPAGCIMTRNPKKKPSGAAG